MTKHVEVHLFKRTDVDLELAISAGLLERDENTISCEDCLIVALARVMV
jgi:predicted nucleic acid-binding protein